MKIYKMSALVVLVAYFFSSATLISLAQNKQSNNPLGKARPLAERLGYPADTKLVIVHADDIGVSHSVNAASFRAMQAGVVNSGSVMVPCPWFPEIAAIAKEHPELDLGLHLTLTSEWKHYRWDSILPRSEVTTLHDARGFLHEAYVPEVAKRVNPVEAEREIRAQVARAKEFGMNPTHLDTHMGSLFQTKELFEAYLRVARDYKIPAMVPREQLEMFSGSSNLISSLTAEDILIDRIIIAPDATPVSELQQFYTEAIKTLRPGVTEIIIHLATDDEEMRAITVEHPSFGAAWRQRDLDLFTSGKFKQLLKESGVKLITWREIGKLMRQ